MVTNGTTLTTTDYAGSFVYMNNALSYILQPEGYIYKDATGYRYVYQYKDHLGSNRLTYTDYDGNGSISLSEVVEEDNYYPFGLLQTGYNDTHNGTGSKYKYNGKELQDDAVGSSALDWYDYGARFYDAELGRWHVVDPHSDKYYQWTPYNYVYNNPIKTTDPNGQDGVIVGFPDYKISTPIGKIGGLGHAGVLLIDNKTGYTKYYEYGRYDKGNKGIVRSFAVSNVKMGKDGIPTQKSLDKVLKQISDRAGHGGKIEGAYIKSDKFKEMNDYAQDNMKENSNPERKEYNLFTNNCGTFAADVVKQDQNVKEKAPVIIDPRPNSIVDEYQDDFQGVHYDPKTTTTKVDPKKEKEKK